ncbi:hypothetical protein FHR99_002556 [Litorivivens lipolytica]|uniref:Uncharacterized protein n=1 Tax=Litorivivens lipolytica TaxID=1524264 RepID=A0A7W4W7I2_9GAMM|nr:hypothetical protein [Litorivivens lipolytica]MBB3048282.1 hypothetical protein [Litorivivens lipolytica]
MKGRCATLTLLLSLALSSYGHEASTAYLYWQDKASPNLRLDIALTDVALHLLPDTPDVLTWEALQRQSTTIARQLNDGLLIRRGQSLCTLRADLKGLSDYEDEMFTSWQIDWQCPESLNALKPLTIEYKLLFANDSLHRAVLTHPPKITGQSDIILLKPESPEITLTRPLWQHQGVWLLGIATVGLVFWVWTLRRKRFSNCPPLSSHR